MGHNEMKSKSKAKQSKGKERKGKGRNMGGNITGGFSTLVDREARLLDLPVGFAGPRSCEFLEINAI